MWGWIILGLVGGLVLLVMWSLLAMAKKSDEAAKRIEGKSIGVSIEISAEADDLLKGLQSANRAIDDWIYTEVVRRGIARLLDGEEIVTW